MKTLYKNIFLLISLITLTLTSCNNEDIHNPVKINSVWTNQADTLKLYGTQVEITSASVGKWIRLNGTGFTGLTKILCNGVSAGFNSTYMTDTNITFVIPSTIPVPGDSTLTVITSHGEYTYKPFIFK